MRDMTIYEVMKHEGFLKHLEKGGLAMLWNKLKELLEPGHTPNLLVNNFTHDEMIEKVINLFSQWHGDPKPIEKMCNNGSFLDKVKNRGLDLILAKLGYANDGNRPHKISSILNHFPLDVTIRDQHGSYPMVVTRSDHMQEFYAKLHHHRHRIET